MKHLILAAFTVFTTVALPAQKTEIKLDAAFKPTETDPSFVQYAEKRGDLYYQEIFTLPAKRIYVRHTSKDLNGDIPEGEYTVYSPKGRVESRANYKDGKLDGPYTTFYDDGKKHEVIQFSMGKKSGLSLKFSATGSVFDSTIHDGRGGAYEWHFYESGKVMMEGESVNDSTKSNTWKYYNEEGQLLGSEKYNKADGKVLQTFDATGKAVSSESFKTEEAAFPGGDAAFGKYIGQNVNPNVPVDKGAPAGVYPVMIQFVVLKDGSVSDVKALTSYGFGMEQEAMRIIRRSPKWIPGTIFGQPFIAYRRMPLTFQVTEAPSKKKR